MWEIQRVKTIRSRVLKDTGRIVREMEELECFERQVLQFIPSQSARDELSNAVRMMRTALLEQARTAVHNAADFILPKLEDSE